MHLLRPTPDVIALADAAEIPGLGFLPVNAYLLRAQQPVLVDTGMGASKRAFLDALWSEVDPADLRWIYLTHPDRDHTGSLMEVLAAAPSARLVTTFLGMGSCPSTFRSRPSECSCLIRDSRSTSVIAGSPPSARRCTTVRPRPASLTSAAVHASPPTASVPRWPGPIWSVLTTSLP